MRDTTERRDPAQLCVEPVPGVRRSGDTSATKGKGWWSILVLVLLSAVAATTALVSQQLTVSRAANAVPNEGFYWSVAQYQIAHHRLKQELRAVAAGEPVNASELEPRRAAVLASRVSILTEPSEVKILLDGVPGYADATRKVAELQQRVGPILEKGALTQADAIKVLGDFKAAGDDALIQHARKRCEYGRAQCKGGHDTEPVRAHRSDSGADRLSWIGVALWLLYAIRSRRRA